jgi:hypothetical protein
MRVLCRIIAGVGDLRVTQKVVAERAGVDGPAAVAQRRFSLSSVELSISWFRKRLLQSYTATQDHHSTPDLYALVGELPELYLFA